MIYMPVCRSKYVFDLFAFTLKDALVNNLLDHAAKSGCNRILFLLTEGQRGCSHCADS